jgi:hypothetical protein
VAARVCLSTHSSSGCGVVVLAGESSGPGDWGTVPFPTASTMADGSSGASACGGRRGGGAVVGVCYWEIKRTPRFMGQCLFV